MRHAGGPLRAASPVCAGLARGGSQRPSQPGEKLWAPRGSGHTGCRPSSSSLEETSRLH